MSGDVDQPSAERSASQKRLPTVHEALQFTPLSSVVPFSPGSYFVLVTLQWMEIGVL